MAAGHGARLRAERSRQRLALLALAARAGCSTTTLLAIERYGHVPRFETRQRIAAALGIPADSIWRDMADDEGPRAA